ncbi:hypothetical protein [Micromonospora marina]|uniref:hypothetical protein n=1 Tax=Micromonospora marina TaxID=307120 RepID=UPI0034513B70
MPEARRRNATTTVRSPSATAVSTSAQPAAVGRNAAAASGSTGCASSHAANQGAVRRLTRPYPAATAAPIAVTSAAYRLPGRPVTPARSTDQAAYPSRTTRSSATEASVSAVPRRPRARATSGATRASAVTASRISARPATPNVAHATAVNTTAAVPSSSPPRTNSRPWTARVEASAPPGRTAGVGGAGTGRAGIGAGSGAGPAARGAGISWRIRAASAARRCRAVTRRPDRSWYASRAASTRGTSSVISRSSRTTSAAGG